MHQRNTTAITEKARSHLLGSALVAAMVTALAACGPGSGEQHADSTAGDLPTGVDGRADASADSGADGPCPTGYEWKDDGCVDIDGCAAQPCFPGVTCTDEPAPQTGFSCGNCPAGFDGDGITCDVIPPAIIGTDPQSPSNDETPVVEGTAAAGFTVRIYADDACTTELGLGLADPQGDVTITVTVPENATTTFYATASAPGGASSPCTATGVSYEEDSVAPAMPTFTGTTPTSPANDNNPTIEGLAEAAATVQLYRDDSCSVASAAGQADAGGVFAIGEAVANSETVTFHATATDAAGNVSPCSTDAITYEEKSPRVLVSGNVLYGGWTKGALYEVQEDTVVPHRFATLVANGFERGAGRLHFDGADVRTLGSCPFGCATTEAYWMLNYSSAKHMLPGTAPRTSGIGGAQGVVYISGEDGDDAVVWDNSGGSFVQGAALERGSCDWATAQDVVAGGGHVYVIGQTSGTGCGAVLWIDGVAHAVPDAQLSRAYLSGGDLYLAGRCTGPTPTACYWKDAGADGVDLLAVPIAGKSSAYDIAVANGVVHLVVDGKYVVDDGTPQTKALALPPDNGFNSQARAVEVFEGVVYVAGTFDRLISNEQYRHPALWRIDGSTTDVLPLESTARKFTQAKVTDVAVFNY